ncbi:hypothetical protein BRADI_2g35655v3 [Brachypodium distachyon]|uniref:Uncharacterized protein n=1 Tax=Brachypodium distachyon TaxID=15368 RepID=A0A2K2DBZ8_BRADI|nr:hypothetical protein BRADI_2g35655v3 [Brachypodium distachyon]
MSMVARFTVQVEIRQGLSPRGKCAVKQGILRRVREAVVPPAEEATVLAKPRHCLVNSTSVLCAPAHRRFSPSRPSTSLSRTTLPPSFASSR